MYPPLASGLQTLHYHIELQLSLILWITLLKLAQASLTYLLFHTHVVSSQCCPLITILDCPSEHAVLYGYTDQHGLYYRDMC